MEHLNVKATKVFRKLINKLNKEDYAEIDNDGDLMADTEIVLYVYESNNQLLIYPGFFQQEPWHIPGEYKLSK